MSANPRPGRADTSTARPGPVSAGASAPAHTTRSEEELDVRLARVPVERVRVRRRVVTETRQVSVQVRREELVLEHLPLAEPAGDPGSGGPGSGAAAEPLVLVLVLHEEVPVVDVVTRPYERVTVRVERVSGERTVSGDLAKEVVEVQDVEVQDEGTATGDNQR